MGASHAIADPIWEAPEIAPGVALSTRVQLRLNDYGNEAALQLGQLTMGLVQMRLDVLGRDARFNLGGGDPESFRLHLDSHVVVNQSTARVQSRIDLSVAGYGLALELPEFDMSTESVNGERAVAVRIPIFEGDF